MGDYFYFSLESAHLNEIKFYIHNVSFENIKKTYKILKYNRFVFL